MGFKEESVTLWENVPKANLHFNITKNIYMWRWMVAEFLMQEKCVLLAVPHTVLV
jgi:hypothetical protein